MIVGRWMLGRVRFGLGFEKRCFAAAEGWDVKAFDSWTVLSPHAPRLRGLVAESEAADSSRPGQGSLRRKP
jgi:hypothetical protein